MKTDRRRRLATALVIGLCAGGGLLAQGAPAEASPSSDHLNRGQSMTPGQSFSHYEPTIGDYTLVMQGDGNLVL